MSTNDIAEPRFGPDFAARVLQAADIAVARRRGFRRTAAGAAAAALMLTGVVAWTSLSGTPDEVRLGREPAYVIASTTPAASNGQSDPLAYMFPDAAPVARFATQYSDESDDAAADSDMLDALDAGTS